MEPNEILFLFIAVATVVSAAIVAFSSKIIHSAFALLASFMGFAALYVYLSAGFLAVTQILIYVGGILILILFGVMMTHGIYDTAKKTAHNALSVSLLGGLAIAAVLLLIITRSPWAPILHKPFQPTTQLIGAAILTNYLLPFEIISVLLLGALIGAVYLARAEDKQK
ncbi:NADH:ubiquinone oxidoreductase subunit J [bacterium BMS3Abin05]|nr:NADH:ubiquinone oxidoreductase subunit J [bacterium BMS3Abin05]GBE27207.1 NADH:ubiquinone oxidoreductase subunit J [bacterium BMS3Bbin03]HDZ12022.1 NADH-quinone oxidoreductase subunit J [Bacteroidota bacterium]